MGFDVGGVAPRSEMGKCFSRNAFWWSPLWSFCVHVAPDIIPEDNGGYFNQGWGLDAAGAIALAGRLKEALDDGYVAEYEVLRQATLDALPDEPCDHCDSTGKRTWSYGERICLNCKGTGIMRPFVTLSPFSEENVRDFAAFLRDCGGFEIW
jgi:hypothetical protein